MIQINAIINSLKLDDVCQALWDSKFFNCTILDCEGMMKHGPIHRGSEYVAPPPKPIKMLIVLVLDEEEAEVYDLIQKAAGTGKMGDGIIWTNQVKSGLHVRTGEALEQRMRWQRGY